MRILLATSAALPDLYEDDHSLRDALRAAGHDAAPAIWSDPGAPWDEADAVVIRSCWDYHGRIDAFEAWIAGLEARGVRVLNAPGVLRWNGHKGYLLELEGAGAPVVPTVVLEPGADTQTWRGVVERAGWDEIVYKPLISADAYETWRGTPASLASDLARAAGVGRPMMAQQFMPAIQREGEWSLVFFGGRFSHVVRKEPRAGDFRVQPSWGGRSLVDGIEASPALVEHATRALEAAPFGPRELVYARIDGVWDEDETWRVMELELIEPELFFRADDGAARRLVEAIEAALI